jgi:hypothetical protein
MSGSLPQLQTFQLPDVGGVVNALQGLELNRMRSQQLQGAEQERNALRQYLSNPDVDVMSPETTRRVLAIAPTIGGPALNAAAAARREVTQARKAELDNSLTQHTVLRQQIPNIMRLPEGDRQAAWGRYLDQLYAVFPQYRGQISSTYSDDVARDAMDEAAKIAERIARQRFDLDGSPAIFDPLRSEVTFPREGAPPAAAPPAAASPAAAGGTVTPLSGPAPAAAAGDTIPLSQRVDPAAVRPAIDRAEGRGANSASSARGQFQFIDNTFVDEFKANFPDIARGLTKEQILGYRNSTLSDGRPIEEFLGEAHTNRNARELEKSGFEPNGANLYLAHFAGLGGARSLLRADANTPVERVLSEDAIKSNPFLRGKTVGQIRQWSADSVDYGPGQARRRLLAMGAPDNTPAPDAALTSPVLRSPLAEDGAPPVANAMTATPVSNAFVKPTIGGGMKADAFLDDTTMASNLLAMPVSDVRPAAPGLPRSIAEARDMRLRREEEQARARARGTEAAKSEREEKEDIRNIDSALDIIDSVTRRDPNTGKSVLGSATGSIAGAGVDLGARLFGYPLDSANAAAALETAHARLASLLPRMRGDLNKAEVELLQAQAAKLGDRTRTRQERATALLALREDLYRIRERRGGERIGPPTSAQPRSAPAAPAEGGWSIRPVQ